MPFGDKKAYAQEILAAAYSQDYLTVAEYEERVQNLEQAERYDEVEALIADLPHSLASTSGAATRYAAPYRDGRQLLEGSGGVVRKRGHWLQADSVVVRHSGSILRLDFDDLEDLPNREITLELDIKGCTARIVVPKGSRVRDETSATGSVVTIAGRVFRRAIEGGPSLVLKGAVQNSIVRVTAR